MLAQSNGTGYKAMLNQSMELANQSLGMAENRAQAPPAEAIGKMIANAYKLIMNLDMFLQTLTSANIFGETLKFNVDLFYRVNETTYIGVADTNDTFGPFCVALDQPRVFHLPQYKILVLIEVTNTTSISSNLASVQLPAKVIVIGLIKARVQGLYLVEAYSDTLENATQGPST